MDIGYEGLFVDRTVGQTTGGLFWLSLKCHFWSSSVTSLCNMSLPGWLAGDERDASNNETAEDETDDKTEEDAEEEEATSPHSMFTRPAPVDQLAAELNEKTRK